jgi:glutamate racemase
MPSENLIYFGDTGRTPYGDKSVETVNRYAGQITRFLVKEGVKAVIIACNTVSAVALDTVIRNSEGLPVIDVIRPVAELLAERAFDQSADGGMCRRIGVLATRRTVNSGHYPQAIREALRERGLSEEKLTVEQIAAPLFASLVEEGIWHGEICRATASYYLSPWIKNPPKTVLLGCTHYPLLRPILEEILPSVSFVEGGRAAGMAAKHTLRALHLLNDSTEQGSRLYYCTDSVDHFKQLAGQFLGEAADQVRHLDWNDNCEPE